MRCLTRTIGIGFMVFGFGQANLSRWRKSIGFNGMLCGSHDFGDRLPKERAII